MVTGGACDLGLHHELLFQLEAEVLRGLDRSILRVFRHIAVVVGKVVNLLERTKIFLRCTVTLKAPAHGMRLCLINHLHLIDVSVAALAGDPPVHVRRVVEVNVVRRLVDPNPFDRLPIVSGIVHIHRPVKRSQLRAVTLNVLMAVPARAARRNVRMPRDIHKRVAIPTIQTDLVDVNLVRKWNRLRRLIAHHQRLGSRVVRKSERHTCTCGPGAECDLKW